MIEWLALSNHSIHSYKSLKTLTEYLFRLYFFVRAEDTLILAEQSRKQNKTMEYEKQGKISEWFLYTGWFLQGFLGLFLGFIFKIHAFSRILKSIQQSPCWWENKGDIREKIVPSEMRIAKATRKLPFNL